MEWCVNHAVIITWGYSTPVKKPGYILTVKITSVKGNKVKLSFSQDRFYGTTGCYESRSKSVTVKLNKKRVGSFTFKTTNGSKGKGTIKLISKNKVMIRLKTTTKARLDRIPPGTNWKYKTLKRR